MTPAVAIPQYQGHDCDKMTRLLAQTRSKGCTRDQRRKSQAVGLDLHLLIMYRETPKQPRRQPDRAGGGEERTGGAGIIVDSI